MKLRPRKIIQKRSAKQEYDIFMTIKENRNRSFIEENIEFYNKKFRNFPKKLINVKKNWNNVVTDYSRKWNNALNYNGDDKKLKLITKRLKEQDKRIRSRINYYKKKDRFSMKRISEKFRRESIKKRRN